MKIDEMFFDIGSKKNSNCNDLPLALSLSIANEFSNMRNKKVNKLSDINKDDKPNIKINQICNIRYLLL